MSIADFCYMHVILDIAILYLAISVRLAVQDITSSKLNASRIVEREK